MGSSRDSLDLQRSPAIWSQRAYYMSDGKRPDGASIVPWSTGKVLVWDVTCPDTLATSYSAVAAREVGAVASEAERGKKAKYAHLEPSHHFVPIAVETLGAFGPEVLSFVRDLE